MGNPEQRCSKHGNGYAPFISIISARGPKVSKRTDRVLFQVFLVYMQQESMKRIIDPLMVVTHWLLMSYEICYRKFIKFISRRETLSTFEYASVSLRPSPSPSFGILRVPRVPRVHCLSCC